MKNVANWTIGSFFRTIGRVIAYIIVGALVAFALSYKPKAATLTPKSTYTNDTNHIIGQDISSFGSNNTYSYSTTIPNLYGEFSWSNASTGVAVSGKAYAFSLGFQYNLTAQKYYDITINFRDRDLRSVVNTSSIYLLGGTSISGLSSNNLSLIGVTNTATSSNNTNKLVVRVYSVQALSYFVLQIYNDQNNITSVNNFGISSVSIQEVDITNSQAIINNQTNNTQNIINNQNDTTQQIIDNQNDLLGSKCDNMLSSDNIVSGRGINTSNGAFYSNSVWSTSNFIQVSPNTTYTFSSSGNQHQLHFAQYSSSSNSSFISLSNSTSSSITVTTSSTTQYIVVGYRNDYNNSNFMLNKGSYKSYCEYGTISSKLDDTTNAINDVNSSLNNDNVDGATDKAGNFFSNFTTNTHGLTSIITAPLSAIQSLTSASCSPLVLPLPFVNQNLTLPCMRSIYVDNFGGFMTLYDTITLGIVSYWVMVRIFALVKDFKNPDHDEVEVMDL